MESGKGREVDKEGGGGASTIMMQEEEETRKLHAFKVFSIRISHRFHSVFVQYHSAAATSSLSLHLSFN